MPILGFQSRFADLVASGAKRQTIRAYRKDGRDPKVGDRLYLWTGLRQPGARKLGEATCERVERINLGSSGSLVYVGAIVDWAAPESDRERIARADGFACWRELVDWFRDTHGLPFRGLLIEWGKLEEGAKR